jgi:hypothetical protein
MPRPGARDLEKERYWREVLADWKSSGLGPAQYCHEKNIKIYSFHDWRREIARRDAEATKKVKKQKSASTKKRDPSHR